ncbi:L-threonine O-3-phosphate decarboxylase [Methylophilus rhizosphaerae]|uniref:threonine-phosphate decarboxylase n=1 Tax=Methylophilus rhizosphaerae TaxID=492660 RepID=A0A1G9DWA2_9PROT|nr:threonine-phosphate decarboxylase CobD [Methylophilus rhizosphaerae]SDK68124.1 L-threonine O-3-phosphate decarboxylase [Methylophilus rhizosphaerae]
MLEHGGNLQQAALRYGRPLADWLDISTGINPQHYPLPPLAASLFQRLPPTGDDGLHAAASAYYGAASLLACAGSQAALQALPALRPTCRVAMPRTMYQEHAHAWQKAGHTVQFFDQQPDAQLLNHTDVLLVCNPNNPTGYLYPAELLLDWHAQLASRGGWLVVDEAFMDSTPQHSLASHTGQPGLWVLRSLGKFFGLAGLRVGFLLGEPDMLAKVESQLGPWTLTGPSRYIARLALQDRAWQQQVREYLPVQSAQLSQLLARHGLTPAGGTGLFQYVHHPSARQLQEALAKQGVWTRQFQNPHALRFGLPPAADWPRLAQALAKAVAEING